MAGSKARRSCRVALRVPIRVFGTDYRGVDFTEDAITLLVNLHGAKIRLTHQLLPDSEIRLVSHPTGQDSIFRVVSKLPSSELQFTYWGVENLDPDKNLWGVSIPALQSGEQLAVRVVLECPICSARDSLRSDETLLTALQETGGLTRVCGACNKPGLWKLPASQQV